MPWQRRKIPEVEVPEVALAAREDADEALRQLRETRRWLKRENEDASDIFDDLLGLKPMANPDGEG